MNDIRLRAPEPEDVDRLYQWENDKDGGLHGHWARAPLSRFQIWEYINTYDADPMTRGEVRMMIQRGDDIVGTVDLYDIDLYNRRASVGIYVDRQYRGRGIGDSAVEAIESYAVNKLGLHTLSAFSLIENAGGCCLFERRGYMHVGILKESIRVDKAYHDVAIFAKILV